MKLIISLLFLGVVVTAQDQSTAILNNWRTTTLPVLKAKCYNHTKIHFNSKPLERSLENLLKISKELERNKRYCEEQKRLILAVRNVTKNVESCYNDDEKYLTDFFPDMAESVMDFVCKDDKHNYKRIENQLSKQNTCLGNLLQKQDDQLQLTVCFIKNSNIVKLEHVSKEKLCEYFTTLQTCILDITKETCSHDTEGKNLVRDLSDAIIAPCSACNLYISSFLLCISFVITKFVAF